MNRSLQEFDREFSNNRSAEEARIGRDQEAARGGRNDRDGRSAEEAKAEEAKAERKAEAPQELPLWKELLFLLMRIGLIALVLVLLTTFLFGIVRYQDPSMNPAIKDGDLVVFYRYTSSGYIPKDPVAMKIDGQTQVRRVVATAGDEVDISEDGLKVNGALQQEQDIYEVTERFAEGVEFPLTVPEGHVFVLGDSRPVAKDSRIFGPVKIDDTLGKVMAVIRLRGI